MVKVRKLKKGILGQIEGAFFYVCPTDPNRPKPLGLKTSDGSPVFSLRKVGKRVIIEAPAAKIVARSKNVIVKGFGKDHDGESLSTLISEKNVKYDHNLCPIPG